MIDSKKLTKRVCIYWIIAFLFVFGTTLLNSALQGKPPVYYDASGYWYEGDAMFQDGGIDVTKTPNAFRGYFLPLFYSALRIISTNFLNNEFFLFNIFVSLEMALIYTVCLPYIFNICVKETKITCGICISYMVLLYFWNGFLITPLSDLPALFFMFISICLMKYMTLHKITWIPFTGLSFWLEHFRT